MLFSQIVFEVLETKTPGYGGDQILQEEKLDLGVTMAVGGSDFGYFFKGGEYHIY